MRLQLRGVLRIHAVKIADFLMRDQSVLALPDNPVPTTLKQST